MTRGALTAWAQMLVLACVLGSVGCRERPLQRAWRAPDLRVAPVRDGASDSTLRDAWVQGAWASGQVEGLGAWPKEAASLLERASLLRVRPIHSSSVLFRMELEGGLFAAFRPPNRLYPAGHRADVAAYRVAQALGLTNVPPTVLRRFSRAELRERMGEGRGPAYADVEGEVLWDARGGVTGALTAWVARLEAVPLEERTAEWSAWLRAKDPVRDHEARAADLSTLLAFDYLIGNWDRFSGANIEGIAGTERLVMRDQNVAFGAPLAAPRHEQILRRLRRVQRFSKSFVEALSRLDEPTLRAALAEDPLHPTLLVLGPLQLSELLDRKVTLLSYVDSLIEVYGLDQVLSFP